MMQVPLYGELDCRLETPSSQEITDRKVWCRDNCRISWDKVLIQRASNEIDRDFYAV